MILAFSEKRKKAIAWMMLGMIYFETVVPPAAIGAGRRVNAFPVKSTGSPVVNRKAFSGNVVGKVNTKPVTVPGATTATKAVKAFGGPTQPEMEAFQPVGANNMVDLFSGDFNYSIPLMDVGGYPIAIGYSSGITMDQEASWVGLGWNINPGTITRNMRGLPDEFNGQDSVMKTASIKANKTVSVTAGASLELAGAETALSVGGSVSLGIFHNTYKGWGIESGLGATIGDKQGGPLTAGLSLSNSSQDGFSVAPSVGVSLKLSEEQEKGGLSGSLTTSTAYSTRAGMKALQFSAGLNAYRSAKKNVQKADNTVEKGHSGWSLGTTMNSSISYAFPSYTPTINLPYTTETLIGSAQVGGVVKVVHPNLSISFSSSKQYIAPEDKVMYLPAYGYLNFQNAGTNPSVLLDFNRERELPYRETPPVPIIAIPSYTYDVFSMTGEGTGGTFRAYRSDIGYVFDHAMKTRDKSLSAGVDVGGGDLAHIGANLAYTRAYAQTGPWRSNNPMANIVAFTQPSGDYEATYFKNPGEMTINPTAYYNAIGGDEVVTPKLYQAGKSSLITTTNYLTRYSHNNNLGDILLTASNAKKQARDKRSQVISYLDAQEASAAGLDPYIENYGINKFTLKSCSDAVVGDVQEDGPNGIRLSYYGGENFEKYFYDVIEAEINKPDEDKTTFDYWGLLKYNQTPSNEHPTEHFSARFNYRIKPKVTGVYTIETHTDDGVRVYVNDSLFIDQFGPNNFVEYDKQINLEKDKFYKVKVEYYNEKSHSRLTVQFKLNDPTKTLANQTALTAGDNYLPQQIDSFIVTYPDTTMLVKEKRVNNIRKANHISEVDVVNADGRRYVYGIPVYNLKQRETTFSVDHSRGNAQENYVGYNPSDATVNNPNGMDNYFSSDEMPAYAHSFLLTGILSQDYVDLTGDGISDDDLGTAVKFKYTKTAGVGNTYNWRTPYVQTPLTANYNEGLRTDSRDDKGSYVYGEKELWYLNSIESKNMIATFVLEDREDLYPMNEDGTKNTSCHAAKRLKEINLYTKADFQKKGVNARPVKTVHFDYTYELCKGVNKPANDSGKLTLKRIWFEYNGNRKNVRNPYVFNYNKLNPDYNAKSFDRWGNYKNPADNAGTAANNKVTNAENPYTLQDSIKSAANVAAWTLDSIVLPSGSRLKVTYESDDYAYVQNLRAANMMHIAGFSQGIPTALGDLNDHLYDHAENEYVSVNVPVPVHSAQEVYNKYLAGLDEIIHFRLAVVMPSDKYGSGTEFVPAYATLEKGTYGFYNGGHTIWFKIKGIDGKGNDGGVYSPLAKTAIQFLRNNLPSKAYPGSEVGDDWDVPSFAKMMYSQVANIREFIEGFDNLARQNGWAKRIDTSRSFVRLDVPDYKKYGGGLRVKRIQIYDNWKAMTGQKESVYGAEYQYTVVKEIDGVQQEISSGVAAYEPVLGGEENPWHRPVDYEQQSAKLGPVTLGYVEKPFGEGFFPGAQVGYSVVRVRSINTKNKRSANGLQETQFYTAYDFPTITDYSLLDNTTKLVYRPQLANFFKVNAAHYLVMSQGFKIELNDMHGKIKSEANFKEGETNVNNALSRTTYYYKTDDPYAQVKHLNNMVMTMSKDGKVDTTSQIGKEAELMMDMREERSVTDGLSMNVNVGMFSFGIPPVLAFGAVYPIPTHEENLFHSAAATKVITRHGIIDSVEVVDKGSKVVTHNLLYDAETGGVILTNIQNEFGDPVYKFDYPAGWAYDGMSGAYKNIDVVLSHIDIVNGKIAKYNVPADTSYFSSGDEVLIYNRNIVAGAACDPILASFGDYTKIWAVDANALVKKSSPNMFFMDKDGKPFSGYDLTMKIIRSGRRNIAAAAGSVLMLGNPLIKTVNGYQVKIDATTKVLNASVTEFKQNWQVEDKKKEKAECANQ